MKLHFHIWKYLYDIGGIEVTRPRIYRRYRHCNLCGIYQRKVERPGYTWWEDSNTPEGINELLDEKTSNAILYDAQKRKNALG